MKTKIVELNALLERKRVLMNKKERILRKIHTIRDDDKDIIENHLQQINEELQDITNRLSILFEQNRLNKSDKADVNQFDTDNCNKDNCKDNCKDNFKKDDFNKDN